MGLSNSPGSIKCEEQIFSISLSVRCGMPSLTKNFLHVGGGGATPPADDKLEILREQRPCVEPVPVLAKLGGNAELGVALLQHFSDLTAVRIDRSTEWVSAIRSAPISPLLNDEASDLAPAAAS
jgi:hypothetical protein